MKIEIVKNILDANDQVALLNRELFDNLKVFYNKYNGFSWGWED